jgi:hypothetical protein
MMEISLEKSRQYIHAKVPIEVMDAIIEFIAISDLTL